MTERRVSAGAIVIWREVLVELRQRYRLLLGVGAVLAVSAIVINLIPRVQPWEAGFLSGFMAAALFGFAWWLVWIPSGLALRGMGPLAEEWTTEALREADGVLAVIPSLKFAGKDVDHVVIAAAGIVAVETKWRSKPPTENDLFRAAEQAADAGRSLRLNLRRQELPDQLFGNAVFFWGPGARDITVRTIICGTGRVTIMGGHQADPWLATLRRGPVGLDYAESLRREIHQLAVQRDRDAITAGPILRWLARTK